jgi:hypothetical protein
VFKRVKLANALREIETIQIPTITGEELPGWFERERRRTPKSVTGSQRRGRKPLEDAFLAQIALDYERLATSGRPVVEIARERNVPVARARGWVHQANRRNFLWGQLNGRVMGRATPKVAMALGMSGPGKERNERKRKGGVR